MGAREIRSPGLFSPPSLPSPRSLPCSCHLIPSSAPLLLFMASKDCLQMGQFSNGAAKTSNSCRWNSERIQTSRESFPARARGVACREYTQQPLCRGGRERFAEIPCPPSPCPWDRSIHVGIRHWPRLPIIKVHVLCCIKATLPGSEGHPPGCGCIVQAGIGALACVAQAWGNSK